MNEPLSLPPALCKLKELFSRFSTQKKKDKCCKSYKDGKRCRKCPKG